MVLDHSIIFVYFIAVTVRQLLLEIQACECYFCELFDLRTAYTFLLQMLFSTRGCTIASSFSGSTPYLKH